ncbi:glycosyltransferase family 2 protein, partial [Staphylococcus saprophyticus]|nr:glycosyltransferase family 2 protein [Staphylococcus saprophyticus]
MEKENFIHYHMGGVVYKKELFTKENYRFDENINYWEDAKLFNTIILEKKRYGLVHNATYFYNRNNETSLSKKAWYSNKRFEYHIENNFFQIIKDSIKEFGYVIPYVQYLIVIHYLE